MDEINPQELIEMPHVDCKDCKGIPSILNGYKDLLDVNDLSSLFEISKQTVYKEMKMGKFGIPIQIGRTFKIPKVYIINRYFRTS